MAIQEIIFQITKINAHNWVRYWITEKTTGSEIQSEYIEIKSGYLSESTIDLLLNAGFSIDKIVSQQINNDAYFKILFKR